MLWATRAIPWFEYTELLIWSSIIFWKKFQLTADESRGGEWHGIILRVLKFLRFLQVFFPIRRNTFAPKKAPANIFSAKICSTCEIMHTNITCKMLVLFLRKRLFCSLTQLEGHVSSGASERYFALFFYRGFAVRFYGYAGPHTP